MATDKYPKHKALNPFFDVVMKGLRGLVDGEHYYDTISEDAQFEFLYLFPGWPEVIRGRENLIAAYSGYGNNIVLENGDELAVHHEKESGVVTLEYQVHGKVVKTGAAYDNRFVSIVTIKNRKVVRWRDYMDSLAAWQALNSKKRTSAFPKQDFEGMVCEIWSGLDICLYHAAYVKMYADSTAMRLAGSRRRETILQQMPQADRDFLQEDVIAFRAHFAGVLWQLHHVANELIRPAYKRCYQEGIVTKERYDALVKALDDDPLLQEIRDYRNLSHQFAGVVITLHDGTTDTFIAHVLPPLDVQAPAQQAALNEQEIQKDVKERELNMKFQSYCDHVSGYCEGLFRIIDTKYKMAVIPRSHGFLVTIPHSYQGQLPEGTKETVYVKAVGSAN